MHPTAVRVVIASPLVAALLALGACNKADDPAAQQPETQVAAQPPESAAPDGQSTEWVGEPADGQGVNVKLPDTPMTNAPAEGAAPAK